MFVRALWRCDHVTLSGLSGIGLDTESLQRLFCLVMSKTGRLLCTACSLGCQEELQVKTDRWLLALKPVLSGLSHHRNVHGPAGHRKQMHIHMLFPLK